MCIHQDNQYDDSTRKLVQWSYKTNVTIEANKEGNMFVKQLIQQYTPED